MFKKNNHNFSFIKNNKDKNISSKQAVVFLVKNLYDLVKNSNIIISGYKNKADYFINLLNFFQKV
jgi:hypothetical protein